MFTIDFRIFYNYILEYSTSQAFYRKFYIIYFMEFKQILKDFLSESEITQTEFARKIGVKPSQVSEWLRGKAKPSYDMLRKMSVAFNISADYFLGLTDSY